MLSEEAQASFVRAIALHARLLDGFNASETLANSTHLTFIEGLAGAWAIIGFIDRSISEKGTPTRASLCQAFPMDRISETIDVFERPGRPLPVDVAPRMHEAAAFPWNIIPRCDTSVATIGPHNEE